MYVIFPADEVVYLSYGRLIYVPQSHPPSSQLATTINASPTLSVEASPRPSNSSLSSTQKTSTKQSRLLIPQPNQTASLDRKTLKNKTNSLKSFKENTSEVSSSKSYRGNTPDVITSKSLIGNATEGSSTKIHRDNTPEVNANKAHVENIVEVSSSKKINKRGSGSNNSGSVPSTSSAPTDTDIKGTISRPRSVSESVHCENSYKPVIVRGSLKVQKSIKERNSKVSSKLKSHQPENLNLSDALFIENKTYREIPRSEIINTRSDQPQSTKSDKVRVRRENSFIRRLFNGQLSNSKPLETEKSVFDFDSLFKRDKSSEKKATSAPVTPNRITGLARDSSGNHRNTQQLSVVSKVNDNLQGNKGRQTI